MTRASRSYAGNTNNLAMTSRALENTTNAGMESGYDEGSSSRIRRYHAKSRTAPRRARDGWNGQFMTCLKVLKPPRQHHRAPGGNVEFDG